jgi:hypothetical protein
MLQAQPAQVVVVDVRNAEERQVWVCVAARVCVCACVCVCVWCVGTRTPAVVCHAHPSAQNPHLVHLPPPPTGVHAARQQGADSSRV